MPDPLTFPGRSVRYVTGSHGGLHGAGPVIGDLRVQRIERSDGGLSFTIVWPDGAVHANADGFLRGHEGSGTQRTYSYLLASIPGQVIELRFPGAWWSAWREAEPQGAAVPPGDGDL